MRGFLVLDSRVARHVACQGPVLALTSQGETRSSLLVRDEGLRCLAKTVWKTTSEIFAAAASYPDLGWEGSCLKNMYWEHQGIQGVGRGMMSCDGGMWWGSS
jgi:hypothetical protein